MKVLYLPLDERPCNLDIPKMITQSKKEVEIISPSIEDLGIKKEPANLEKLWSFVLKEVKSVDTAILSVDMLLYGGLVPSRIHHLKEQEVDKYIDYFKQIKKINPKIKLYLFDCIMRSPQYDSADEEPDYYENYGRVIHRRAFLNDKKQREFLTKEEESELEAFTIPKEMIEDYENRRAFNLKYNLKIIQLVKDGLADFLVIPQDDAAEYGYTAIAQSKLINTIAKDNLENRIHIYPGADEVASSLLARAWNKFSERETAVYVFYSSTLGPEIIPNYEDRPMNENLKYHLDVTNSFRVDTVEEADFILAINSPGKIMEEAFDQDNRDISYSSFRNLLYFVKKIERLIKKGYKVALCDSAFSNGGDLELLKYLDQKNLYLKLLTYAGWNTNSNTLGTVLASSIYEYDEENKKNEKLLIHRLFEDLLYQSKVRQDVKKDYLRKHKIPQDSIVEDKGAVLKVIKKQLKEEYEKRNLSKHTQIEDLKIDLPWNRMFEIKLDFKIKK